MRLQCASLISSIFPHSYRETKQRGFCGCEKHHYQAQPGEERIYLSNNHITGPHWGSEGRRNSSRNLEAGTEAREECCFLPGSQQLVQPAFLGHPGPPTQGSPQGLGPPTSIRKWPASKCPGQSDGDLFLIVVPCFPDGSGLCQADPNNNQHWWEQGF